MYYRRPGATPASLGGRCNRRRACIIGGWGNRRRATRVLAAGGATHERVLGVCWACAGRVLGGGLVAKQPARTRV